MDEHEAAAFLAARYSRDAEHYAELWAPELVALGRELIGGAPLRGAARVLDLGGGIGAQVPAIQEAAPRAVVVVGDRSEGMVRRAPGPRLVLDARRLALREDAFDAVLMMFMLFHLPDPGAALAEVGRVVREGGVVAAATWGHQFERPALEVWEEELERHGAGPADPLPSSHDLLDTQEKLAGVLERAGFHHIRTWSTRSRYPVTLEEFVALRTRMGPSRRRLETLAEELRPRCIEAATKRVAAMDPSTYIDDAEALFAVASA